MAVLMPNTRLGIRTRTGGVEDRHGDTVPGAPAALLGPWPGRTKEADDGTWTLAVDTAAWPISERDIIEDTAGTQWVVRSANLLRNNLDPSVDYVRVQAYLRAAGDTKPPRDPGGLIPGA